MTLTHFLRPELYLRAGDGSAAEALAAEVTAQLRKMREGADAVLTASAVLSRFTSPPAQSADALLAEAIAQRGAGCRVELFHSDPLAADAVTDIYGAIRGTSGLVTTPLPEAWDALRHGDTETHAWLVRAAVDRSDADLIALAEPAMADVTPFDNRCLSLVHVALRSLLDSGAKKKKRRESVT